MHIAVDMGHTPTAPGAAKYLNELNEDRAIGNALIKELRARGHKVTNVTAPNSYSYPAEINYRINKANRTDADLFVSIHLNSGGGTGVEVLHYPGDAKGKVIAARTSAKLAALFGLRDRGAKARDNLGVIVDTKMTAVLVETVFVDSKADKDAFKKHSYAEIASTIADGLLNQTSKKPTARPGTSAKKPKKVSVAYALAGMNGKFLPWVTNYQNSTANGYAGIPGRGHCAFKAKVTRGTIRYRVHRKGDPRNTWSKWYQNGQIAKVNGMIDGIWPVYIPPKGEPAQHAHIRSQTVARTGWLSWCVDNHKDVYHRWCGMLGEATDRVQMYIK